jgi:hypothetical protein
MLKNSDGRVLSPSEALVPALDQAEPDRRQPATNPSAARQKSSAGKSWPELAAFAPVHAHKSRHECVLLPFEALIRALDQVERDHR